MKRVDILNRRDKEFSDISHIKTAKLFMQGETKEKLQKSEDKKLFRYRLLNEMLKEEKCKKKV